MTTIVLLWHFRALYATQLQCQTVPETLDMADIQFNDAEDNLNGGTYLLQVDAKHEANTDRQATDSDLQGKALTNRTEANSSHRQTRLNAKVEKALASSVLFTSAGDFLVDQNQGGAAMGKQDEPVRVEDDNANLVASVIDADRSETFVFLANETVSADAPVKNKQVLLVLEMIPFAGALALDRFYLGTNLGLAAFKLVVSLLTCCVGGLVWGVIDAVVVVINAFQRKDYINSLGMQARFDNPGQVEGAHTLAVFVLLLQLFFCCGGCTMFTLCFRSFWRRLRDKDTSAGYPVAAYANPRGSVQSIIT